MEECKNKGCSKMETKNSGYCDEHRLSKKTDIVVGTGLGLAFGALASNPIGLIIGAIAGALIGNASGQAKIDIEKMKNKNGNP